MALIVALLRVGLVICAGLTAAGFLAPWLPWLELPNHFRPWIVLGCALLVGLQLTAQWRRVWPMITVLTGVNLVLLVVPLALHARRADAGTAHETLKIVSLNVWGNNRRMSDVAAYIASSGADIVVLQELPKRNADVLLPLLRATYPHQVSCNGCRNLAMLSKRPWSAIDEQASTERHPGLIVARFASRWGNDYRLVVLHPSFPFRASEQARDYRWLTSWLGQQRGPLMVVGDFNLTPWAWKMWRLQRVTGLVRHGTWQRSWSGHLPMQTFLIDNVLSTPDIRSVSFETGPNLGSDHLPVVATVALP